ncbi:MAG: hypothetical protein HZA77_09210 [Candidatus Schekmanbacteria bacterium]|nr:hypothetical protein [Candidatus Schekmanbacteria bacterium]
MKIGIVGSRRRNSPEDKHLIREKLFYFLQVYKESKLVLVSGGCPDGADKFAEELALELNLKIIIHYPDKSKIDKSDRWSSTKANYARNKLIADDSDILIAVVAPDRKGGTENTIKYYEKFGKKRLVLI